MASKNSMQNENHIIASKDSLKGLLDASMDEGLFKKIETLSHWCIDAIKKGGKLVTFGNGGSAADAQHIAAEFINRFRLERRPYPAIALTTDTSIITSIGNDYSFDEIFKKQVEAIVGQLDIALGISTSGTSRNVHLGLNAAKVRGAKTVLLSGMGGAKFEGDFDLVIAVPSQDTPRIQEVHLFLEHQFCELVEEGLTLT